MKPFIIIQIDEGPTTLLIYSIIYLGGHCYGPCFIRDFYILKNVTIIKSSLCLYKHLLCYPCFCTGDGSFLKNKITRGLKTTETFLTLKGVNVKDFR